MDNSRSEQWEALRVAEMDTQPDLPSRKVAVAALLAASAALGAVGFATTALGGRGGLVVTPAVVTTLAAFCVLFPDTRGFGLLLAWNALGLGLGLLVIAIFSVGALMVFPVVLLVFALTSWPRMPGDSIVTWPTQIALIGGVAVTLGFVAADHLMAGM